jgi:sugar phosphate isomerase/epimerase
MNKLNFILFVIAIFICSDWSYGQSKKLYAGQIGVQPYTFRKQMKYSVAGTLDMIKNMGFTEVEGGGEGMEAKDYKKLCDKHKLKITSYGTGYKELVDNPMKVVKIGKTYGAKYVMCAWIPHNTGSFNFANAKKAVEDFNKAGKVLAENGISLCYHAHGYEVAAPHEDGTLLDYMVKNTDPRYVNFEMDIFWIAFGGGDPVALLKKYPNRWKMMHIKDMQKGIKKDHTGLTDPEYDVTLGTGQLDIKGILKTAKEVGVVHYYLEDESNRIFDQLPLSIKYLRETQED